MARLHTASTTARGATISFIGGIEWLLRAVVINAFNFQDTRYGFRAQCFQSIQKRGSGCGAIRGPSITIADELKVDDDASNKLQLSGWFPALSTHTQA